MTLSYKPAESEVSELTVMHCDRVVSGVYVVNGHQVLLSHATLSCGDGVLFVVLCRRLAAALLVSPDNCTTRTGIYISVAGIYLTNGRGVPRN